MCVHACLCVSVNEKGKEPETKRIMYQQSISGHVYVCTKKANLPPGGKEFVHGSLQTSGLCDLTDNVSVLK